MDLFRFGFYSKKLKEVGFTHTTVLECGFLKISRFIDGDYAIFNQEKDFPDMYHSDGAQYSKGEMLQLFFINPNNILTSEITSNIKEQMGKEF